MHDKIEFEIIPTCFELRKTNQLNFLNNLEKKEYEKELKKLTLNIILNQNLLGQDILNIQKLDNNIINFKKYNNPIQRIFFLIHSCKELGTLSFAGIARCAFISTKILRDLVALNMLSNNDLDNFYTNINTITKNFNLDLKKLKYKIISKKNFLKKYGHLRPSTYSISSNNYNEAFDKYFYKIKLEKNNIKFKIDKSKKNEINKFLTENMEFFDRFLILQVIQLKENQNLFTKYINEIFISIRNFQRN